MRELHFIMAGVLGGRFLETDARFNSSKRTYDFLAVREGGEEIKFSIDRATVEARQPLTDAIWEELITAACPAGSIVKEDPPTEPTEPVKPPKTQPGVMDTSIPDVTGEPAVPSTDPAPPAATPVTDPAASATPVVPAPEPIAPVPEPIAPVPEPIAPVPEPIAPVPEPIAPVPEPIVTDTAVADPAVTDQVSDVAEAEGATTDAEPAIPESEPSAQATAEPGVITEGVSGQPEKTSAEGSASTEQGSEQIQE